jgi:hypothetical protein
MGARDGDRADLVRHAAQSAPVMAARPRVRKLPRTPSPLLTAPARKPAIEAQVHGRFPADHG